MAIHFLLVCMYTYIKVCVLFIAAFLIMHVRCILSSAEKYTPAISGVKRREGNFG